LHGLLSVIALVVAWDAWALTSQHLHSRGRIVRLRSTISSDVWTLTRSPLRRAGFFCFWTFLGVHLMRRPK
jgi:hypothetical protein